jgi:tetratricopeptide (TPR) repeat protein
MRSRRTLSFAALSLIATASHAQTLADARTCDRAIEGNAADRATVQRIAMAATNPLYEFATGCMAAISNQPDSAIAHFEAATRTNPRSSAAFLWLGNSLGRQAQGGTLPMKMRLAPKIRDAYSQAVTLDGSNIDAREGLMQFHMQAPAMMGGDKAKAREQADAIFALNPFRGLSAQITLASSSGDKPAVERYLAQATTQFPDSVLGWANLVAVQADAMRGSDAFATIARWEARQTNPMYRLFAIGRTAAVTGQQLDRGVQALQQYLRGRRTPNDPPFANANLRLGQIYERQNKKSQARAAFEAALATNPNLRDAQLALERVK